MDVRRVFPATAMPVSGERFETLLQRGPVRIECILSAPGSASGPYDQDEDEWVLLLQGHAVLEIAGAREELAQGEAVFIPAHMLHSVLDTSSDPPCIWLAVFLPSDAERAALAPDQ